MSLNETVSAERLHIGFFGLRNAGKSSLVNAVTGQNLAVVSDVKGTTTDPVRKAMELLPLGPVVIIDTPGLDDQGDLGQLRVEKARRVLAQVDIAVLVVDATAGLSSLDRSLLAEFQTRNLPYVIAWNKADLLEVRPPLEETGIYVSARTQENVYALKEKLGALSKGWENQKRVVGDLLRPGDVVVLVVPIDSAAPKGRLILPQQLTIRDILDAGAMPLVCRDTELSQTLDKLKAPPAMVITDSQVFGRIKNLVPETIPLTSFSILMARYKGELSELVRGASMLKRLKDGDRILISEGCTHHRQCGDIGTEKLPAWIRKYSGAAIDFDFTVGGAFPSDLSAYALVVHCGGCMLNEKEMKHRLRTAVSQSTPMVNYGVAIACMNGILARSLEVFPNVLRELEGA